MSDADTLQPRRWYEGLGGYHWLVLAVAALGWSFDTMDQWLYVQVKTPAISELLGLPPSDPITQSTVGAAQMWFILGWATGGLFFGMIGDRLGRTKTMALTILIYSAFTGLSGLSGKIGIFPGHIDFIIFRFLTGLGIGGEFAAGASLVAETFPAHARPTALAIVQACSALGNVTAGIINFTIGSDPAWGWRWVFAIGVIPAFLLFVIFMFIREPDAWVESRRRIRAGEEKRSSVPILDLFRDPDLFRHTVVGVVLAAVGVVGFWGIGTWSAELMRSVLNPENLAELKPGVEKQVSLIVMGQNLGGFFGVFAFAILAQRIGRKPTFAMSLVACAVIVPAAFFLTHSFGSGLAMFSIMGFVLLTLFGGYAIYFPELFPTKLRATGTGFCYNVARYVSAFAPLLFGKLSGLYGPRYAALFVSAIFVVGLLVIPMAPETKDKKLPE